MVSSNLYSIKILPFLALRILPSLCASCLLDPPWDEIWMRTLASGRSNELSATCNQKMYRDYILFLIIVLKQVNIPYV